MQLIKRIIAFLVLLVVLAFGMLFSIQNEARAPLDILIAQLPEQKVAFWVLLAFALGGVIGMLISTLTILKLKSDLMLLKRKKDRNDKELDKLRTSDMRLPAMDSQKATVKS